ncbi:hypothetical protein K8R32_03170 [bacterium]|nr:hypothetical protein [bacterium]
MQDSKTSMFKTAVGITIENKEYLVKNKGRKSIAGKLHEIINFYKRYGKRIHKTISKSQQALALDEKKEI